DDRSHVIGEAIALSIGRCAGGRASTAADVGRASTAAGLGRGAGSAGDSARVAAVVVAAHRAAVFAESRAKCRVGIGRAGGAADVGDATTATDLWRGAGPTGADGPARAAIVGGGHASAVFAEARAKSDVGLGRARVGEHLDLGELRA